jgi:hypothetical protein
MPEEFRAIFSEVLSAPGAYKGCAEFLEHVADLQPDVVYFPSVGMAMWSTLLATQRIAPIQVASQGHPATTCADTIDFVIIPEGSGADPSCYTERVALQAPEPRFFPPSPFERFDMAREQGEVRKLAIPARLFKLSTDLIKCCERISEESPCSVEFHFFPNEGAIALQHLRNALKGRLHAVVHAPAKYEEYARTLAECHIHLSSFPFGATNSLVDSLLQGLVPITLTGPEFHSSNDSLLIRRMGLPEWLICGSEDEYVAAAVRLLHDDAARRQLSAEISVPGRLEENLIAGDARPREIGNILHWLHKNWERISLDGRKVWTSADRFAFDKQEGAATLQ